MFELVAQIRNSKGEPTGKVKSIKTDKADKLAAFWVKIHGFQKRKKSA